MPRTRFKGPGKAKIKLYADQLIDSYYKVEGIAKKNDLNAFPTPHREAKDYPFYVITHKRMYRNQSGFTARDRTGTP